MAGIRRSARLGLVLAAVLAMALGLGAPRPTPARATGVPPAIQVAASPTRGSEVMGAVDFGGVPVVGARVRIRTLSGKLLAKLPIAGVSAVTGPTGVFRMAVPKLPEWFIVEAVGGTAGGQSHRRMRLSGFGHGKLAGQYINPATTLAVKYRARYGGSPMAAQRHVAGYLGLARPTTNLHLGRAGRVLSSAHDPAKLAGRASSARALTRLAGKAVRAAHQGKTTRAYRPDHYQALALGTGSSGLALGASDEPPDEGCPAITAECLFEYMGEAVLDLVKSAACTNGAANNSLIADMLGCEIDAGTQLAEEILAQLTAMQTELTNIQNEITALQRSVANLTSMAAYKASNFGPLQNDMDNATLALLELSAPAVTMAPFAPLAAGATAQAVCSAAYPQSSYIPASYQGKTFTQTPPQACLQISQAAQDFAPPNWSNGFGLTTLQAMTSWGLGNPATSAIPVVFQNQLSGGGSGLFPGSAQNALNQLLASLVGLQAQAFQVSLAWQNFYAQWTNSVISCANSPLPSSYPNPASQPMASSNPCATAQTAWFVMSLESHISTNGPVAQLPTDPGHSGSVPYVIDGSSTSAAGGTAWWAYPVDLSGLWVDAQTLYPYYPGYGGHYQPGETALTPPLGQAYRITADYPNNFVWPTMTQASALVADALRTFDQADSGNAALASAGFVGVGADDGGNSWMNWDYLTGNLSEWPYTFQTDWAYPSSLAGDGDVETFKNCSSSNWPILNANTGPVYGCQSLGNENIYDPAYNYTGPGANITGVWGSQYVNTSTDKPAVAPCPSLHGATWGSNPVPGITEWNKQSDGGTLCSGPSEGAEGSYYGLLRDVTVGNPLWTSAPFSSWQAQAVPALPSGPLATTGAATLTGSEATNPPNNIYSLTGTAVASVLDPTAQAIAWAIVTPTNNPQGARWMQFGVVTGTSNSPLNIGGVQVPQGQAYTYQVAVVPYSGTGSYPGPDQPGTVLGAPVTFN